MLDADEPIVVLRVSLLIRCATHAQSGVIGKLAQENRKVVLIECDVAIQISDDVKVQLLHSGVPRIKGKNLSREMPFTPLRRSN